MKIGLFFGSFNPIHTGHLILSSYIANFSDLQQIWFVVSPQNPFKTSAALLNEYQRLYLVQLAIEGDNRFKACDIEFSLSRPSYTIHTILYLKEKYPHDEFSVLMGSDSFQNITKWKNYQELIKMVSFIVYERPGFPPLQLEKAHCVFMKAPLIEISSTAIRNYLKEKKSIRYLVPDKVREEIEKSGYYK
jgi:nicotinate-nucleotide adenylyltransferase